MAYTTDQDLIDQCRRYGIHLNGVFSKDRLPKTYHDGGYIINLQDHNEGHGTHWTAFWIEKGKSGKVECAYYDSFGAPPPTSVQHYLHRFGRIPYNTLDIQNVNSGVCGYYVFHWLLWMSRHGGTSLENRFNSYLRLWDENPEKNRQILEKLLRNE